jgi:hypothetical protein
MNLRQFRERVKISTEIFKMFAWFWSAWVFLAIFYATVYCALMYG